MIVDGIMFGWRKKGYQRIWGHVYENIELNYEDNPATDYREKRRLSTFSYPP